MIVHEDNIREVIQLSRKDNKANDRSGRVHPRVSSEIVDAAIASSRDDSECLYTDKSTCTWRPSPYSQPPSWAPSVPEIMLSLSPLIRYKVLLEPQEHLLKAFLVRRNPLTIFETIRIENENSNFTKNKKFSMKEASKIRRSVIKFEEKLKIFKET